MSKNTTQKADQKKYRLDELINKLDREIAVEELVRCLEKVGISRRRFFQHRKIKLTDKSTISEYQLQVYSKLLNVPMHQLLNYQVEQESIIEIHRRQNEGRDNVLKEFSLS